MPFRKAAALASPVAQGQPRARQRGAGGKGGLSREEASLGGCRRTASRTQVLWASRPGREAAQRTPGPVRPTACPGEPTRASVPGAGDGELGISAHQLAGSRRAAMKANTPVKNPAALENPRWLRAVVPPPVSRRPRVWAAPGCVHGPGYLPALLPTGSRNGRDEQVVRGFPAPCLGNDFGFLFFQLREGVRSASQARAPGLHASPRPYPLKGRGCPGVSNRL